MNRIVAIDSDDEEVTATCRDFRESEVYPQLPASLPLRPFAGANATRRKVVVELIAERGGLITASGHGFPTRFTGQGRESIFEIGAYQPSEVADTVVHLLSCETAKELGADLVDNGCAAFLGYDEVFVFPEEHAALFLGADAQIDLELCSGRTAGAAYDAAVEAFDAQIARMLQAGKTIVAAALIFNRDHLCGPSKDRKWGDPNAKIK